MEVVEVTKQGQLSLRTGTVMRLKKEEKETGKRLVDRVSHSLSKCYGSIAGTSIEIVILTT